MSIFMMILQLRRKDNENQIQIPVLVKKCFGNQRKQNKTKSRNQIPSFFQFIYCHTSKRNTMIHNRICTTKRPVRLLLHSNFKLDARFPAIVPQQQEVSCVVLDSSGFFCNAVYFDYFDRVLLELKSNSQRND